MKSWIKVDKKECTKSTIFYPQKPGCCFFFRYPQKDHTRCGLRQNKIRCFWSSFSDSPSSTSLNFPLSLSLSIAFSLFLYKKLWEREMEKKNLTPSLYIIGPWFIMMMTSIRFLTPYPLFLFLSLSSLFFQFHPSREYI